MVFGEISLTGAREVLGITGAQILLEDLGQGKGTEALAQFAADTVPSTSFTYLADEFFATGKKG
jgi:hypothetical protein